MTGNALQPFHQCLSGAQLQAALESALGQPLLSAVARQVAPARVLAIVAGGSIPLGLAHARSDVDLIAITEPSRVDEPSVAALATDFDGTSSPLAQGPAYREQIIGLADLELDLISADADELAAALVRLARSGVSLNLAEIRLLSRLKTGWCLHVAGEYKTALAALRRDRNLDIRATVWYYVTALQDYDDAIAALRDSFRLAAHLGRLAAERAVFAYFSSLGYAFLGSKWLRLLVVADETPQRVALRRRLLELYTFAEDLFFPTADNERAVVGYLHRVHALLVEARSLVESDAVIKVAFARTPQLAVSPSPPDDRGRLGSSSA